LTKTYVLIHGAGGDAWQWHLLEAELRNRRHNVVAMDLPADDESANLQDYATAVVNAIGDHTDLVVVAHSFGGYSAPLVCAQLPVAQLVLVAGMIPVPGESAYDMFANTSHQASPVGPGLDETESMIATFMQDVPADLAQEAMSRWRDQAGNPLAEPWPLHSWPDVATHFLLCRNDRMFPAEWMRQVVSNRLGIVPDEIDSGHFPALRVPFKTG
jgi:pimeloyl-ACP methyl ester carboxylesterase